jgi:hypothetical protein
MSEPTEKPAPLVTAVLVTHMGWKGQLLRAGAKIRLERDEAARLLRRGVVRKPTKEEAASLKTETEEGP